MSCQHIRMKIFFYFFDLKVLTRTKNGGIMCA
nr:MAG TPA: hypothetical protein [Caudoviricetes sp.]